MSNIFVYYDLPTRKWKGMVKYEFDLRLKFNKMVREKRLNKIQKREFKRKLKLIHYFLWTNSPHLKNKEEMRDKVYLTCINDLKRFNSCNKSVKQT